MAHRRPSAALARPGIAPYVRRVVELTPMEFFIPRNFVRKVTREDALDTRRPEGVPPLWLATLRACVHVLALQPMGGK